MKTLFATSQSFQLSFHLPASAVCSPLLLQMMHSWEWQWPYEFDPAPFLFILSWKSHTILQRIKHIWSFKRNSLISWKHFCEPFHTSSTWLSNPFERAQCFSIDSVRLGVYTWNITTVKLTSTVSYMIALSHKRAPTPYFGAISCIGSKFTQMSLHLGASFVLHLRSTAWSTMPVAAEQKYDWGDCRERLRSSRSSAQSVCVRRSKIGGAKAPLAPWFCCPCTMHIWGKKLCVILHQRLLQGIFA